jgi:hypothetical protein
MYFASFWESNGFWPCYALCAARTLLINAPGFLFVNLQYSLWYRTYFSILYCK